MLLRLSVFCPQKFQLPSVGIEAGVGMMEAQVIGVCYKGQTSTVKTLILEDDMADAQRYKLGEWKDQDGDWFSIPMIPYSKGNWVKHKDYAALKTSHQGLLTALKNMVHVARFDDWEEATTGRQIFLVDAEEAIAKAEALND